MQDIAPETGPSQHPRRCMMEVSVAVMPTKHQKRRAESGDDSDGELSGCEGGVVGRVSEGGGSVGGAGGECGGGGGDRPCAEDEKVRGDVPTVPVDEDSAADDARLLLSLAGASRAAGRAPPRAWGGGRVQPDLSHWWCAHALGCVRLAGAGCLCVQRACVVACVVWQLCVSLTRGGMSAHVCVVSLCVYEHASVYLHAFYWH